MRAWMVVLGAVACFGQGRAVPEGAPAAEAPPAEPAPVPAASAEGDRSATRRAVVVETMDAGGYTYARLDACGEEAWAAGPESVLEVGSTVETPMGTAMTDFRSPSLDRTFDAILFVDWFRPSDSEIRCAPEPAHPSPPAPAAEPAASGKPEARDIVGTVVETMEAGGYRYARLDRCGAEVWIAGPPIPIQVGEVVTSRGGFEMKDFASPTLDRRFGSIWFVGAMAIAPEAPACE